MERYNVIKCESYSVRPVKSSVEMYTVVHNAKGSVGNIKEDYMWKVEKNDSVEM